MKFKLLTIILVIVFMCPSAGVGKEISIGCFASLNEEHEFWKSVRTFMTAVAEDLKIDLRWHYAEHNQVKGRNQIIQEVSSSSPVDAALIVNYKKQASNFFTLLNRYKTPSIIHVVGADHDTSGLPRAKHPFWIAEMVIDEEKVGYELAIRLIDDAIKKELKSDDGKIHLLAIAGDPGTLLSKQRETGLLRAVEERKNHVVYDQLVTTRYWSTEEGYQKVQKLIERYPKASVVWSANDDIAIGVVKGIREAGKIPGKDIVTGGIDWVPEALKLVRDGEMVCSIGGLSMHGGWAAILLYDYLNGIDFKNDVGVTVTTSFEVLTEDNVNTYLNKFGDGDWSKVDFRQFSKVLNPELKKYDFSMEKILKAMGN